MLLEQDFRRVLKLFELDKGLSDDIDCLHKALHAFPEVRDRVFQLMSQLGSERYFVLRERFDNFGRTRRMLL